MNISKVENFNKYIKEFFSILALFSLCSVPWIEFINNNLNELDFIFNNNFLFLLFLYFLVIFVTYLILSFFTSLREYSLIAFISVSVWILFQHNILNKKLKLLTKNIGVSDNLSSEIGLLLIILLIFLCFTFLKRKKFLKNFLIFYLSFNLLFSIIQFTKGFQNQNNFHVKLENSKNSVTESIKRSNIYFFILDGMMPLNEFENYYKNDFSEFKDMLAMCLIIKKNICISKIH